MLFVKLISERGSEFIVDVGDNKACSMRCETLCYALSETLSASGNYSYAARKAVRVSV